MLLVEVANIQVGQITLAQRLRGLGGKLDLDSKVEPNAQLFPANFPAVSAGTVVETGALACALQRR